MCDKDEQSTIKNNEGKTVIQDSDLLVVNKLEDWVATNSKDFATYNRVQIATYSRDVQKAIMRSFSPDRKKDIWQSKVNYLLTSDNFSNDEKKYFEWFAEQFKTISYDKAMDKNLSQEMYDKVMEGIKKFGWSKQQAYEMFFTVGNINNNSHEEIYDNLKLAPPGGNGTWCECYYDLGCPTWDCDSGANCGSGSGSPHDCGVFGDTDCDGNC